MANLKDLNIKLRANLNQFSSQMQNAERSMQKFAKKATKMGYSLSQYGLKCKNTGSLLQYQSEEALYEALETPFLKPEDR